MLWGVLLMLGTRGTTEKQDTYADHNSNTCALYHTLKNPGNHGKPGPRGRKQKRIFLLHVVDYTVYLNETNRNQLVKSKSNSHLYINEKRHQSSTKNLYQWGKLYVLNHVHPNKSGQVAPHPTEHCQVSQIRIHIIKQGKGSYVGPSWNPLLRQHHWKILTTP